MFDYTWLETIQGKIIFAVIVIVVLFSLYGTNEKTVID